MNKAFIAVPLIAIAFAYPSFAAADHYFGGHHHGHGHGHRHHHDYGYSGRQYYERVIVYPAPQVQYYAPPPPPPVTYYPPQPPVYYQQVERPHYIRQHSSQGLVGGMVGSALGYQMGQGDPVAAGIGAAAGAFVGNRW